MKPEQRRDTIKRLNQLNDNGGKVTPKATASRRRDYPCKPTPAQIERFEALRARVMGNRNPV
ncbi:hypothetical protein [Acetobacter thailandicus]|uniref:hypothetical protein n=1 Tax=Acetobacter thailandicus TaxID=1502842 RepID=UPI001BA5BA91|nr:hypothetical protein [Acetobacter thailandicus]MBS1003509.1 hypothetical protein [Acetobacter thailandicus]